MTRPITPCPSLLLAIALLVLALAPARPAAAAAPSRIGIDVSLTSMLCREESDEIGDDDPFVVMAVVNLRSGRFQLRSYQFHDIESGEGRQLRSGALTMTDSVEKKEDLAVLVSLVEWDRDGNHGYVTQEGADVWWTPGIRTHVTKNMQQVIATTRKAYAAGVYSAAAFKQSLLKAMRKGIQVGRGDDEGLGELILGMPGGPGQTGVRALFRAPVLQYRGDGSNYELRFDIGYKRLAQPRMLRIQIRDKRTRQLVPGSFEVRRGNQKVAAGKSNKLARIEQKLMPGQYRVRVTAPQHHPEIYDVKIGNKDEFIGADLRPATEHAKPLPNGAGGAGKPNIPSGGLKQRPNLNGTWNSEYGKVVVKVVKDAFEATISYTGGGQGTIRGKIKGNKIGFLWYAHPLALGHGELTIVNGKKLSGWAFNASDKKKSPWNLTR